MTLEQIFAFVELNAAQIRAVATGAVVPTAPLRIVQRPEEKRPRCLVCGNPIGLRTCRPVRQAIVT